LLEESQMAMVMAREGCCAVRIPLPERFAVHKLAISQLRTGRNAKSLKDMGQATTLSAALAADHPGALESAVAQFPKRGRKHLTRGIEAASQALAEHS